MGIFCEFANYGYLWDSADRIETVNFLAAFDDESVTYAHDNAGQVTGADRDGTGAVQDETYVMDSNGNRESVTRDGLATKTWSVGPNNQLLNDGKYAYTYDLEGNRLTRTVLVSGVATGEQYVYTWDYRNRLTEVRIKDAAADTTYDRGYKFIYDDQNRLAVKQGDLDGDGDYDEHGDIATFLWDGQNMTVLTPGGQMLSQIYGPQTDQLLFVRETNETFLPLADHLNTVRDVIAAKLDAGTYEAVHVEHNRYDSFGRVIQREQLVGGSLSVTTNPSYIRAGYTGKYFDISIGAQYNIGRWYDAEVGRWISEDPIGFAGGTDNLSEYVGNASVIYVDPNGLATISGGGILGFQIGPLRLSGSLDLNISTWWGIPMEIGASVTVAGGPGVGLGAGLGIHGTVTDAERLKDLNGNGTSICIDAPVSVGVVTGNDDIGNTTYKGITGGIGKSVGGGVGVDNTRTAGVWGLMPWNPDAEWWFGLENPFSN